ncbi:MAG: PD-(D/E)XK nuclease family protein, partial [Clostridia bacterium]|nr:PD-(D/E)XK nuclease family protein [Clostridia bacterium]
MLAEKNTAEGDFDLADAIRSSWDIMMSILNSMVVCFSDANILAKEYIEALKTSISFATVGVIPQMIDEVTFGSADRIRPSRPKYAFILGANQGVFPKQLTHGGIFAANERKAMIDLGLDITDATLDTASYEDFLVYANTCCATKEVYISYSSALADGSAGHPSAFLESILKNLDVNNAQEPMKLEVSNAPETLSAAFTELCKRIESDVERASILKGTGGELDFGVNSILNGEGKEKASITPETAKALFGSTIKMSPTKFDDFNHCRFKYFCKYGLKAQKLYPAEFSAMQRGTLIHYVLQRIIEEYGKDVSKLSSEKCCEAVDAFTDEYLDSISGYRNIENERMSYLVSNIRRSLYYVTERIAKEFAQSKFEPVKCELKIGDGGEIPAINIPVEDYGNIVLNGTVDRLDRYGAYIRVIDYKSGSKTFKLPDILYGQNMQMLLYLYTLSQNEKYGGTPAGVLYVKAKRVNDGTPAQRRMNGIVLADEQVVYAMEEQNGGEFIPKFNPEKQSDAYLSNDE